MLKDQYPYFLANQAFQANADLEVTDKFTGKVATRVALADAKAIDAGIAAAVAASEPMREFPPFKRQAVLEHCVMRFRERFDELAMALCIEAGKPIRDARGEVTRLIDTFKVAAEESVRINGEVLNLEISPRARGYRGFTRRVPIGPCSFISPFNFPLNLAAHKVAPGIAAGCPFVLKPASRTPIGALIIGEVLAETDLPKGAFSILPAHRDGADLFTVDERLKLLSFTGSPAVGWDLKARAGKKKVVLELGGNAACIVDADQRDRLDQVIERVIFGAFYQSGQSCIGVQRILVHEDIYEDFRARFVAATSKLVAGDPKDEKTFIGPMIDEKEAQRLDAWIQQAVASGARLLCGGKRTGAMLEASVLEGDAAHLAYRRGPAGRDNVVVSLGLLDHQPHCADIVLRVTPVALGVDIAQAEFFLHSELNAGDGVGHLARHELAPAQRAFMIEEDTRRSVEAEALTIVHCDPVAV